MMRSCCKYASPAARDTVGAGVKTPCSSTVASGSAPWEEMSAAAFRPTRRYCFQRALHAPGWIWSNLCVLPRDLVRTCPYCSASPASFISVGRHESVGADGQVRRWYVGMCPACGGAAVFEVDPGQPNEPLLGVYPDVIRPWEVAGLEGAVATDWSEAITVFRVGAWQSAVVACGRTLEAAADALNISGNALYQRIETMLADGLITARFKEAMDYVRLIRNTGAHAGQPVSRESAEGTMRFTQQALRILFEVPDQLSKIRSEPPELENEGANGESGS